jgi:3-dehydroquinate synthetase
MLLDASEQEKTLETVMKICSWLLEQGADRDALVLAVGGGITTDLVGFAASIYKRGVRFAYMPTTLLAQVDAAIGGKTGVNFDNYKNMLGVIRQPKFTFICPQVLESLPPRDFLSGAAEMLKTFIIENDGSYEKAVEWLSGYAASEEPSSYLVENSDELAALIASAVLVKAGIVTRDQFEGGERRKLNLGHTFGHAIETLAQRKRTESDDAPDITHGEAVAMGMVLAAELSDAYRRRDGGFIVQEDGFEWGLEQRLEADFLSCGLPIGSPFKLSHMTEVMKKDKKAEGDKIHFVLPKFVGEVEVVDLTIDEVLTLMA